MPDTVKDPIKEFVSDVIPEPVKEFVSDAVSDIANKLWPESFSKAEVITTTKNSIGISYDHEGDNVSLSASGTVNFESLEYRFIYTAGEGFDEAYLTLDINSDFDLTVSGSSDDSIKIPLGDVTIPLPLIGADVAGDLYLVYSMDAGFTLGFEAKTR